jgi:hypothetical protein
MLKNYNQHWNLCVCYIYQIHTCIAQSTATRKIILDAILSPLNFALLKWRTSVNSGLYRRYTSWINTDKLCVSLVHTAQWHPCGSWRVQHAQFRLLCTYLGVCSSWRSKQLRPSPSQLWAKLRFILKSSQTDSEIVQNLFFFFFFRRYNFNLWTFCPSKHIISTYCDPGCS